VRAGRRAGPARQVLDGLLGLLVLLLVAFSWLTHVVVCAMEGFWASLVFGLVVFPVALVHGVMVWITAWL
jgi:hypothetical protein